MSARYDERLLSLLNSFSGRSRGSGVFLVAQAVFLFLHADEVKGGSGLSPFQLSMGPELRNNSSRLQVAMAC